MTAKHTSKAACASGKQKNFSMSHQLDAKALLKTGWLGVVRQINLVDYRVIIIFGDAFEHFVAQTDM